MNSLLCTLSLFLASSLVLFHARSVADVVADTCKKSAASSPNVNYDYCVKALGSDSRSSSADVQGLGLIALNLLESSVTSTASHIQELLKQKQDPYVQKRLTDCSDQYSDAADSLKGAVGSYQAKQYLDVQTAVSAVSTYADTCESQFKDKEGATSPLTKQNGDVTQLSYIELAIVVIVKGS
ncbi:putative invertase inhibitor [Syzygium oleosum]|uniref:putative invertase inhibitor n=1 Tax=Syzygium oleosum TaxID=219896 RepID=UPI0011D1FA24|nr:putative invertase inhibitor [Syzygium oleosum]